MLVVLTYYHFNTWGSAMDVARSKRVIILDPSAGRSANMRTMNNCSTLDNMFWGCCAINPFTLMDMPFAHAREFRQGSWRSV
jgi:hypothetical protein